MSSNYFNSEDRMLTDYTESGNYESPIFGRSQNPGSASPDRDPDPSSHPADFLVSSGPPVEALESSHSANSANPNSIDLGFRASKHRHSGRTHRHDKEIERRDHDCVAGISTPLSPSSPLSPSEGFRRLGNNSPPSSLPETRRKYHVCYICDAPFNALKAYGTHMWHDHNLKEFECPQCGAKFARDDYLKSHLKGGKCLGPLPVGKRQASTSPKSSIGAERERKRAALFRCHWTDQGPTIGSQSSLLPADSPNPTSSLPMPTPASTIAPGPIPVPSLESFFEPRPRSGNQESMALPIVSQPAPQSFPLSQYGRNRGLPPVVSRNREMIAPAEFAKSERTIEQLRITVKALQTSNDMTIAALNAENADLKTENERLKANIRRLEYTVQQYHHSR